MYRDGGSLPNRMTRVGRSACRIPSNTGQFSQKPANAAVPNQFAKLKSSPQTAWFAQPTDFCRAISTACDSYSKSCH
ncbi:hypothetical protein RESH_00829 [Rhodopirellula europaea SH398]|uniref:Uncharacterized protein n=2 Tax=Rhodopirellula europaea TaxID=1263866 RepID=M5SAE2_9BACT|nr:hypothetical protein RE6C_01985 [Rhodopirellula europaea 6C]EMI28608.1 hypothetical protein RESH_00829 [Rhodopirellula europaea SH398]